MDDRGDLMRELMAVFDDLPPEPLDPKSLAALCRKHGAGNVLAMIELRRRRGGGRDPR